MKNMTKTQKIVMLIIAIIILAGIIVTFTVGFNFELKYQKTQEIDLYLEKTFENSDIIAIAKEVMPEQKVIVQKVEVYKDSVRIIAKEITEEQKQALIEKVNEKYGTEFDATTIEIKTVAHARLRDLLKKYVLPFVIATIIIVVYMALRYRKLSWGKVVLKSVAILVVAEVTLYSLIAITRIPVGITTMPLTIAVYLITLLCMTNKFEKQLKEIKE